MHMEGSATSPTVGTVGGNAGTGIITKMSQSDGKASLANTVHARHRNTGSVTPPLQSSTSARPDLPVRATSCLAGRNRSSSILERIGVPLAALRLSLM